ncbi:UDP-3-O-(3-hydroxymyristoyl)glucosamine N-acyltransferase [Coxiella-like endosymbiont of Rhipicephalus sanguineus]|uniref:UDP-3-O-(3-hydroxymyristoyl)glucosamine N-acyltransferase n=1 Tax=Coxiella-like endosymbiont of Rhipicephalus sanguineus TaxID=1955402 RepID=UPI00203A86C0|nr:UDP-3-O-(3-hydroxymyristoyl)glucosamine N-acyltransferase [Coxiella-like endosymbiont of Rhipicephalus sanguineus]MBT8506419.1 UDP-3-O-(3-hydroxymyristoyl)glucosamine N-acyltransferase [Coxiella-like endosymbiont of Rhipicephalus sanguineus]
MKFEITYTLNELANAIGATVKGHGDCKIHNIASIVNAQPGEISFLVDRKYQKYLTQTKASALLLDKKLAKNCPINALIMPNPKLGFIKLLALLRPEVRSKPGIHPTAVIGENCQIDPTVHVEAYAVIENEVVIGSRTIIGAGTSIGRGSQLGADCCLYNEVTLYHHTIMGDRNILHSGVVIGADGFGLAQDEQRRWIKIPQVGRVVIGDDVEIGANTTIDRGALEDTVIGNGVKLDNLIMIGHNVRIGDHTAIAGCAGIAGSTTIGRHCMIGAGAGLNGHIDICDNVVITGMGMIQKSITKPGVYSSGTGMQPSREWHKSVIRFWQLEELAKRLKRLERLYDERDGNQRD